MIFRIIKHWGEGRGASLLHSDQSLAVPDGPLELRTDFWAGGTPNSLRKGQDSTSQHPLPSGRRQFESNYYKDIYLKRNHSSSPPRADPIVPALKALGLNVISRPTAYLQMILPKRGTHSLELILV